MPSRSRVDVGFSTAWSYFFGYLKILTLGTPISERIRKFSAALASPPRHVVTKLFLLCPLDGQLPESVESLSPRLRRLGTTESIRADVGSVRNREYGAHAVYALGEDGLLAIDPIFSVRTLRLVAEAMSRCGRIQARLSISEVIREFAGALRWMIDDEPLLRDQIKLVIYDPSSSVSSSSDAFLQLQQEMELEALQAERAPSPSLEVPLGVGIYLAWAFLHGYLLVVTKQRNFSTEVAAYQSPDVRIPLKKAVVVCPLDSGQQDDVTKLDSGVSFVTSMPGTTVSEPNVLKGRSFGGHSIYRVSKTGDCFALEIATPLRTLDLGITSYGHDPALFRQEAISFVQEINLLLREHPTVGQQFAVVGVDKNVSLTNKLTALL